MAAKTSWHRHGAKLRHSHRMYTWGQNVKGWRRAIQIIIYNAKSYFGPPYVTQYNISLTHPQCYITIWNDTSPEKMTEPETDMQNGHNHCRGSGKYKGTQIRQVSSMLTWNFTQSLIPLRLGSHIHKLLKNRCGVTSKMCHITRAGFKGEANWAVAQGLHK